MNNLIIIIIIIIILNPINNINLIFFIYDFLRILLMLRRKMLTAPLFLLQCLLNFLLELPFLLLIFYKQFRRAVDAVTHGFLQLIWVPNDC